MNILLSVIVPVYNVEKYLKRCVESIINQTYKNLEIILIDDGSTDNSGKICDEYAKNDYRIRVVHKENGGLSSARNTGIDEAAGEFIFFIDSDDYIHPQMIEKMADALLSSNSDLCICGMQWVNEDGSKYLDVIDCPVKNVLLEKDDVYKLLLERGYFYFVTAVNKMYRKSIFNDLKFPVGRKNEDEFLVHHIFSLCQKVICIADKLYFYVQRENSIMHSNYNLRCFDGVDAFIDRAYFFKRNKMKENYRFAVLQAYGQLFNCLTKLDVYKNKTILYKYVKKVLKLLKCDLRSVKLLLNYYKKVIRGSLKYHLFKINLQVKLNKKRDSHIILLATPQHGNLGDQAIVWAEYKILRSIFPKEKIVEIPNDCYVRFPELCRQYIRDKDIVVVDGGGNLGSLWKKEDDKISKIIDDFKNNQVVIFPQTCFYAETDTKRAENNYEVYKQAKKLSVMLRDKASFDLFNRLFPGIDAYYVPDIVLALRPKLKPLKKQGVLLCFREDVEKNISDEKKTAIEQILKEYNLDVSYTSTILPKRVSKKTRKRELEKKWEEFASAQLIITDRLHAMIFSVITQTPCIAFDNISKKVSGVYKWIDKLDYIKCVDDINGLKQFILPLIDLDNAENTFAYPIEEVQRILKK